MNRRLLASLAVAAGMTFGATEARAADLCWVQQPSTLTVCSGYAISGLGTTTVNLDVWAFGTLQPIRITDVGLFNAGTAGSLASVTGFNVLNSAGTLFSNTSITNWSNTHGNNLLNSSPNLGAHADQQGDGVIGDNTPLSFGGWRTTGTDGSSYVRFTFTTTSAASQNTSFGYFAQGNGVSLRCFSDRTVDSDYSCGDNPGITSVVPEPSTYALMASGLLGIFGFARRRRNVAA